MENTLHSLVEKFRTLPDSGVIAAKSVLAIFFAVVLTSAPVHAKKGPFTGDWISSQYTNGKEFLLKLEQADRSLIGWEGRLPPDLSKVPPDLQGTIRGKEADIEVQHQRGYKAHAHLRLQKDRLVWQLMESDNRSSRYFPLASTLHRRQSVSPETAQIQGTQAEADQPLWTVLARSESFDGPLVGEGGEPSPIFSAYRALLTRNLSKDDMALQGLLKTGSSSGKLYAAAIIWEANRDNGMEAFRSLAGDDSKVNYRSGCETLNTSVSEIARSFLEKGGYLEFPSKKN